MKSISKDDAVKYSVSNDMEVLISVEQGETFELETHDAFGGELFKHGPGTFDKDDIPLFEAPPPGFKANPVAGPVHIEGAENGDQLAIHIENIIPEDAYAATLDGFGNLDPLRGWEECQGNLMHSVELKPGPSGTTSDGEAVIELNDHEWSWELNPHIGTILTAPGRTEVDTLSTQGPWGGVLNTKEVNKGSTVYLNSYNDGGLLFVGDIHASQGDGEYAGVAIEASARVQLSVEVVDDVSVPGVLRIENEESVVHMDSTHNAGNPQTALNNCYMAVIEELVERYGLGDREAFLVVGNNPSVEARVFQFIQPHYFTFGVQYDKEILEQRSKSPSRNAS